MIKQILNDITSDQILNVVTAVTSLLAVIIALFALVLQFKFFNKERKPVIVPIIKEFTDQLLPDLNCDWETEEKIDEKFSNTKIKLTNYGGTTANIESYYYFFSNFKEVENELKRISDNDTTLIITKTKRPQSFKFIVQTKKVNMWFDEINATIKRGNILRVDEELEIYLPSYFMILSNFLLKEEDINILPELTLLIKYTDIDKKENILEYLIYWDFAMSLKHKGEGVWLNGALVAKPKKSLLKMLS
ncbi:hypothetical protein B0H99_101396 [Planomicrobium soli]|uniref:Uncharacterized protein n=1 Tax=Planomicrobium soli TaxID=1176648 RepID=A0A2P8H7E7_9BACL|nr:hypothetical protein [Planomicrobium soli]PSL42148.1 hypothetical protein B0H99_101396 [Planomicrobium soli]